MTLSFATARPRAPQKDRTALVEPPLDAVADLLEHNRRDRQQSDVLLGGRPWRQVAEDARAEFLQAAHRYTSSYRDVELSASASQSPIFLTGHQPTIFHPGVWFKNFVSGGLARRYQGTAVNLLIDSDTARHTTLRVPGGTPEAPAAKSIAFDQTLDQIPYEERAIADQELFAHFGRRVADQIRPLIADPLIGEYWPLVGARGTATGNLGLSLAQGRHQLEAEMGLSTLEIPQSQVCGLPSAHWLMAVLLEELPRLAPIYNRAVRQYRQAHRIRSLNHPVPDLAIDGQWLEAPLWMWQSSRPRRRGLFVRRVGRQLELSDRHGLSARIPSAAGGDVSDTADALAQLPEQGIKLRTRALGTTLLARLLLGDVFLHGIGGAKYDQLTDALIERFFGIEPPKIMVLSATLHLPIQHQAVTKEDLRQVDQTLRQLTYHPEKHLDTDALRGEAAESVAEWVSRKRQWIDTPATAENARRRYQEIRLANGAMQAWVTEQRERLSALRADLDRRFSAATMLAWREYGFCLYPKETLREFYAGNSCYQTVGYAT